MRPKASTAGTEMSSTPGEGKALARFARRFARRALAIDLLERVQGAVADAATPAEFARRALAHLQVDFGASLADIERIPADGPAIVVANHPYGGLEGLYLAALLLERRPDVRILANRLLLGIPSLRPVFIPVDPFGGEHSASYNRKGLRQALRHVADGGLLVLFPAGTVSHLHLSSGRILDPPWSPTAARLIRLSGCQVIPIHFAGSNSALFQLAGLINPALRTALLPREILNKRRHHVSVAIGAPIRPDCIVNRVDDEALAAWLRLRTYGLANASGYGAVTPQPEVRAAVGRRVTSAAILESEISSLPTEATLVASGDIRVVCAHARQLPHTMQEVGRLRETAFRAAGEGTGGEIDLDRFDDHYLQLLAWNDVSREIVGGYRIGLADELVARFGLRGLYSHSLFAYGKPLLRGFGPALELGRSFIRPEYQRSYAPLLLMWRGICEYVLRNPRYRTLFGPVSISSAYRGASRELLIQYLKGSSFDPQLSRLVRPRRPIRRGHLLSALGRDIVRLPSLDDVSELIAALEPDGKGVPVLLRHYLKVGGRVLAFNIDRNFNDAIDGLIAVDLTGIDGKVLQRYMGKDGATTYRAHHRLAAAADKQAGSPARKAG